MEEVVKGGCGRGGEGKRWEQLPNKALCMREDLKHNYPNSHCHPLIFLSAKFCPRPEQLHIILIILLEVKLPYDPVCRLVCNNFPKGREIPLQ